MDREEILEKLIPIIREVMDSQEEIDEETSMQEDLGIDSLDFYNLLGALESAFHIRMPERVLAETETVGDIADAVMKRMEKQG
ncbi:MAG: acyl carrier protein [Oribacterium sp.]|uniref:acyl carrier protein n=1 Tax=Oribacterium sp. oral taxon 078 TaxID=652706 RepID=UPI0001BCB8A6|nr:phosphopantetheine-binding protein [Oribacterium sp. oral taxon 078]EFE90605.1 putative acyl carrier protein [Oribacterium sp. oral taxon 078 str. F0262]ERL22082.1 putative acyl carrier protein [Oribacterium sp. oral taxon 078 str. F0263]